MDNVEGRDGLGPLFVQQEVLVLSLASKLFEPESLPKALSRPRHSPIVFWKKTYRLVHLRYTKIAFRRTVADSQFLGGTRSASEGESNNQHAEDEPYSIPTSVTTHKFVISETAILASRVAHLCLNIHTSSVFTRSPENQIGMPENLSGCLKYKTRFSTKHCLFGILSFP
jgi:hypothetical protein